MEAAAPSDISPIVYAWIVPIRKIFGLIDTWECLDRRSGSSLNFANGPPRCIHQAQSLETEDEAQQHAQVEDGLLHGRHQVGRGYTAGTRGTGRDTSWTRPS